MKLQPGDYVSTKGMTEEQYHAIARRFIEAGAENHEYPASKPKDWDNFGWQHNYGLAHWDTVSKFGGPNRLLTIDQILSDSPEWDGKGLPPVGAVVECLCPESKVWVKCDIIGPYGDYVVGAPSGGGFYGFDANELRPIRSDRDKAIDELVAVIIDHYGNPKGGEGYIKLASSIYDAGYRKQQETKA